MQEAKLNFHSDKTATLMYKNKTYPGLVVSLPCVVESQKSMDNKQYYKIADISTLVVIYPNSDYDFDKERKILELSGLTPPMKYAKSRRFRKKPAKMGFLEEIERKVAELIEKDLRAKSVEIMKKEDKDISDELDVLAAEIETKLVKEADELLEPAQIEKSVKEEKVEEAIELQPVVKSKELEDLEKAIEEKRKQMESALNPILKKRFQGQLDDLLNKLKDLNK